MSKSNNFAVIDIGTNTVKCIAFVDGQQVDTFRNAQLTQAGGNNLNPEEVLWPILSFMTQLETHGISSDKIYIAATEAFRKSSNKAEISEKIKAHTGRSVHVISPKREAYLSALGGLSYIQKNFKGTPTKVIYIESGGGSTEISLIDATKRSFLAIEKTISVPFGSKGCVNTGKIAEMMGDFSIDNEKNGDIAIVINSSTASRIMARKYNKERYNPKAIAENQYTMRMYNFFRMLNDLPDMEPEKIKAQYYLNDDKLDGFLNQGHILRAVLQKIYLQTRQAQLSTTIGGLKHGLVREIAAENEAKDKISEQKLLIDFIRNKKTKS